VVSGVPSWVDSTSNVIDNVDTRTVVNTPFWYLVNYPKQVVNEFKHAPTFGLTGHTYMALTTYVPFGDSSGGYPHQEARLVGKIYTRYGLGNEEWSSWKELTSN
jgi:hypothetical protein